MEVLKVFFLNIDFAYLEARAFEALSKAYTVTIKVQVA